MTAPSPTLKWLAIAAILGTGLIHVVEAQDAFGVRHPLCFAERSRSMKLTRNLGMLLLGIWLFLTGLIPLLSLSFSGLGTVMAILAIAAGALIILGR
jgi:hypothetical protein